VQDEEEAQRREEETQRRERFKLIANRWNGAAKQAETSSSPLPLPKSGKSSSNETPQEMADRRQREYKERSQKVARERAEKEAKVKMERAETLRRDVLEKEQELQRLRDLEDRTGYAFEVEFPVDQALEFVLCPIKLSCFKMEESKTGTREDETVMDCCLVTASKNNNLPSNILPGDILININKHELYSPQVRTLNLP
jgi:hypothetical protein